MSTRALTALVIAISGAACGSAAKLSPGPQASIAPVGQGEGAVASEQGIHVEVRSQAWSGDPVTLETEMTPLYLKITNNSNHSIVVRHAGIALVQGGIAFQAISPHDVDETVRDNYTYPDYPYYWTGSSRYRSIELPTRDMVRLSLPEGVLAPGETIEGFVYFDDLDDDIADVMFLLPLVDASSRRAFGRIEIPFVAY